MGLYHCFRCGQKRTKKLDDRIIKSSARQHTTLSDYGKTLWQLCYPLHGVALDYLKARCCVVPPRDGDLRYHPSLKHPSGYAGPALVALVTDAITAAPMSLHRTWITSTGKANIGKPRLLLAAHRKSGCVVRLWPNDAVTTGLGVGEGIETCLAAAHGFTPMWSCIDAGNLTALPVLNGVSALTIFADHDPTGVKAADALGQRWADASREAVIVMSACQGRDIADEVVAA